MPNLRAWACSLGLSIVSFAAAGTVAPMQKPNEIRPPSVPLIVHDPYFSIWSPADRLTDTDTVHWTGAKNALSGSIWIDGRRYRFLGASPSNVPALEQVRREVLPTRTIVTFGGAGITLTVTFTTPSLPDDLDLLSRPASYVTFDVKSTDGRTHAVRLRFAASAEIAAGDPDRLCEHQTGKLGKLGVVRIGTVDQPVLRRKGDGVRIDWGRLLLAGPSGDLAEVDAANVEPTETPEGPVPAPVAKQCAAGLFEARLDFEPFDVGTKQVRRWLIAAYDDEFSIQYFKQNLRPYWRRDGDGADDLLRKAAAAFPKILDRCKAFDDELMADLARAGGEGYATLCALAYRQCLGGCKLAADPKGQPLLFPKENTSNGCIATVDVIYPMAPLFLLFGPSLTKAMLVPVLDYGASSRWKFPFAPHDLGTYPQANAQAYGGGERTEENQMPVEESANLLILVAALAEMEKSPTFAERYWPTLTRWAEYLKAKGFDPENQLCTDDFLGHLAHNVNLSAKATIALAGYARLCAMRGDPAGAKEYGDLAKGFAKRWTEEAADGDHYRLTFDKPGTWSQKYNLVWDRILGLDLFADDVRAKEMAHCLKVVNPYGVPLDSRGPGAKIDWSLWTATLTQKRSDFEAVLRPTLRYVNETPQRVGVGDWYDTSNGHHLFMHSRPVVGGFFLQALYDKTLWAKWAGRDSAKAGNWAPIPEPAVVQTVIPAADTKPALWQYTLEAPPRTGQRSRSTRRGGTRAWADLGLGRRLEPWSTPFGTRPTSGCVARSTSLAVSSTACSFGCTTMRTSRCM